jgi:uncharacterized protein with HEPN domain
MRLEVGKYLYDIQYACRLLARFCHGKTLADYAADDLLRSGVERQFEIVGEALSRMLKLAPELASQITDTRSIISFRNKLIHGYAEVSNELVWGIVQVGLPVLQREIESLLSAGEKPAT